ncbi:hypothetical protein SAMN05414139_05684 [Burkholderia sp. D7]|nr:hypothetical protein SAMN05414139_05684 [Burkholderia sp. D7]
MIPSSRATSLFRDSFCTRDGVKGREETPLAGRILHQGFVSWRALGIDLHWSTKWSRYIFTSVRYCFQPARSSLTAASSGVRNAVRASLPCTQQQLRRYRGARVAQALRRLGGPSSLATPHFGQTTSVSEATDKSIWHRRHRRAERRASKLAGVDYIARSHRAYSNPRMMGSVVISTS